MARSKSTSEKDPKQQSTLNKKCCLFSHLCKTKEEELHICCSFCKKTDCEIRCCDSIETCKYLMTPEECFQFSFKRGEVDIKEYNKYNKIYPHNKKDLALIQEYKDEKVKPKKEKKENKSVEPTAVKKGRGRPAGKKPVEEQKPVVEKAQEPVKRGRGRPPKLTPQPEVQQQPVKRGRGRPPKKVEGENK